MVLFFLLAIRDKNSEIEKIFVLFCTANGLASHGHSSAGESIHSTVTAAVRLKKNNFSVGLAVSSSICEYQAISKKSKICLPKFTLYYIISSPNPTVPTIPSPRHISRISFSCPEVVEIMFSDTTAVRMDSSVQLLVTMKNTKA